MTEHELRALVRDAIARTRGVAPGAHAPQGESAPFQAHLSHAMFVIPTGSDADGPCIIEPSVACNHCGYCKSYGH